MRLLIKNGRLIDPANNIDEQLDILLENGTVAEIGSQISDCGCEIIDATGMWVTPGLIDMHVHLRDPGLLHKETIATGAKSAAAGGFTTICCMPNTDPVVDAKNVVEYINDTAARDAIVNIIPIGSITWGLMGEELSDINGMKDAGILAISDDGKTVDNPAVLKAAMEYAASLNLPMLSHCEDSRLCGAEAEEIIIARDIILARVAGVRLHICHISTAEGVELVRAARAKGIAITAEVCPHHFTLTYEDMPSSDANFKMSPPLRSRKDRDAVLNGLKDGTITVIATDHAPHHEDEKKDFETAPNGIIGMETAVPLCISQLVETGVLTPSEMVATMTVSPAKILGLDKGHLSLGAIADITIIDPNASHRIDKNAFHSLSRNTPFHGRKVTGRVMLTIVGGEIVYKGAR